MLLNVIPWENKRHQLVYIILKCKNVTASNVLSGVHFDVSKGALNEYQMLLPNLKTQDMNNFLSC